MRPLRTRLQQARKRLGIPWEVLERDYVLSWILAGVGQVERLRDTLVFKGGTALKKCYFGDYRFSEDLDFSALEGVPSGDAMDERILKPVEKRTVIHEYGEPFNATVQVYSLEEVVAEKLRAILQHVQQLEERGWSRSRARDYYDLWRVLGAYKDRMVIVDFGSFLNEKCAVRNVAFTGPEDFFQERMLADVERTWEQWLGPLVPGLPSFDTVIRRLRSEVADLVSTGR
jgi:predicted nucleotidyltransferase component of viral defense system